MVCNYGAAGRRSCKNTYVAAVAVFGILKARLIQMETPETQALHLHSTGHGALRCVFDMYLGDFSTNRPSLENEWNNLKKRNKILLHLHKNLYLQLISSNS